MEEKQLQDDAVFCIPSLPPFPSSEISSKAVKKTNEPQLSINYTVPSWSKKPPAATEDNTLNEEGFCNHYYLEVIKTGTVVEQIKLEKEFISFGRLDKCDVLCEHPSLSRFHAVLQYSNGEDDKDFPEGFYVYDLASTHGTFINKTRLESNKYTRLNIESMVKFGLSTRMYILHGPKSKNNSDDLNINLTHEQMRKIKEKYNQLSLKLKIRKEIEEEDQLEERSKKSANWGMSEIEDETQTETDENVVNPFAVIEEEDESFYSNDPRKALKHFFEREAEELIYDVDEIGVGKFKCIIQLPIQNKFGGYMTAEVQHEGKKKDCMTLCALEACRILNAEGVLKQSRTDIIKRNKEKDWENADYYDSDEDTYLDRTGDVEKKRLIRMAQAGKLTNDKNAPVKNKTHTFDSITTDIKNILREKYDIESKLEKCRAVMKAVEDDDLDSYIESLKVGTLDTLTRAKMKKRLVEISSELKKLDKLLNISKPPGFDAVKWKDEITKQLLNEHKKIEPEKEVKQVQQEKKSEIKAEEPSVEITKLSPVKEQETIVEQIAEVKPTKSKRKEQKEIKDDPYSIISLSQTSKKSKKCAEEKMLDEYTDSKDYAVWVPPTDQRGDGITKLNEKFGY